ncbi:ribokinase [Virgibacillus profundi]|uniref:Ribokinase n=1 Tax=Virgibacillus profundi TaxID=2024555 RepID=A0A2A2I9U4_9BACI|nr:ribokinase [Virgibacillus profundi]PAV28407.1 ribokinase [Virgibacillus profundi]PXY52231.1 ribokinase [Virgibacillus profundi]
MNEILVVGSLNMDLVTYVPYLPAEGETIASSKFLTIPGGKGANQAVAMGKLGASVRMIGKVGTDEYGSMLLNSLRNSNVKTDGIIEDGLTGMAFINVAESGENNIVLVPGANAEITKLDIDQLSLFIETSDVIIMQLEIPLEVVKHVADIASKYNKKLILNPAPVMELSRELLQHVHTIIPNEVELGMLTKSNITSSEDVIRASKELISLGVKRVVVTLGSKGAVIVTNKNIIKIPAFQVEVVDTTAAGDSFIAGFAVGITKGMSDEDAAIFASKVAGIVVTREGAQSSIPTLDEIDKVQLV